MKGMMKKVGIMAVILIITVVSVVGAQGRQEPRPVQLSISIGSHGRFLIEEAIEDFESKYPHIEVEIVAISSVPTEAFATYSTMFAARDDSLDVIGTDPSWPYHMARAGWIEELSEFYEEDEDFDIDDFNEAALGNNIIRGGLYGLPLYADALMFYYRRDLLDAYGYDAPPRTWSQLVDMVETILDGEQDPNLSGYIYQAARIEGLTCNFMNFLSGVDGNIIDEQGNVVINDAAGREALGFMVEMIERGISPISVTGHNPNDDRIQFENRQAIFMNNWPFAMAAFSQEDSPVYGDVGIGRMPGRDDYGQSTLGGVALAMNNFSNNKEEAWLLMEHLTSYEWNKIRALEAGLLPARESVWDDDEVLDIPGFKEMRTGAMDLIARPTTQTQYYMRVSDEIQLQLNRALIGELDYEKALDIAAENIEDLID